VPNPAQRAADRPIVRRPAAALALAFLLAPAPAARAASPGLVPVSLEAIRSRMEATVPVDLTARGLEIRVESYAVLQLPLAAQELELDVEADAPILLSWAPRSAGKVRLYGPPWRYTALPRAPASVPVDLRATFDWTPTAQVVLVLKGAGTVVLHALRARPAPPTADEARAAHDRALLWAPESIGHTTINFVTPSFWSASRGIWLSDVVAGTALAALLAVLAAAWLRRRSLRPGPALSLAALVALALWDAHFLVRFLPMANLSLEPDREARLRRNYYFDPEFGELAALARATLRPGERVGTMASPRDWFSPQTLCFLVAPRPCAIVHPGEEPHPGISRVGRLGSGELDAIVSFHGGPLPEGFVPVASVTSQAVVARRR
jgi:hypothetical protein